MTLDPRPFDLVGEPLLDDRAVEALARAVADAAVLTGETLSGAIRREAVAEVGEILEPVTRTEIATRDAVAFEVRSDDGTTIALVAFEPSEAIALADLFFGGPGTGAERTPTSMELQAITMQLPPILGPLLDVIGGAQGRPTTMCEAAMQDTPGEELVRLVTSMTIGETTIETEIYAPDPDQSPMANSSNEALVDLVGAMPISFDVELGDVVMTALDARELAVGDVVVFDQRIDDPATVRSGNRTFVRGELHVDESRRRLEVTDVLPGLST